MVKGLGATGGVNGDVCGRVVFVVFHRPERSRSRASILRAGGFN